VRNGQDYIMESLLFGSDASGESLQRKAMIASSWVVRLAEDYL